MSNLGNLSRSQKKRLSRNKAKAFCDSPYDDISVAPDAERSIGSAAKASSWEAVGERKIVTNDAMSNKWKPRPGIRTDLNGISKFNLPVKRKRDESPVSTKLLMNHTSPGIRPTSTGSHSLNWYPFETEYGDHFETSLAAYRHIE